MTTAYFHHTPMTDTTELRHDFVGTPLTDLATQPLHMPSHGSRHEMPRVRRLRRLQRIAHSAMVRDIRDRLPMIPAAIGGLAAAYGFVLVVRGLAVVATVLGVR